MYICILLCTHPGGPFQVLCFISGFFRMERSFVPSLWADELWFSPWGAQTSDQAAQSMLHLVWKWWISHEFMAMKWGYPIFRPTFWSGSLIVVLLSVILEDLKHDRPCSNHPHPIFSGSSISIRGGLVLGCRILGKNTPFSSIFTFWGSLDMNICLGVSGGAANTTTTCLEAPIPGCGRGRRTSASSGGAKTTRTIWVNVNFVT